MLEDASMLNTSPASQASAEKVEVNWDAPVEVKDATADGNIAAVLPPSNFYPLKLKLDNTEKGLDGRTTVGNPPVSYVGGQIIGEVVAVGEDYDGTPIYHYINSITRRGKPTSDLHHLLNCAGQPASNKMSVKELLDHAKEVIESGPAVYALIDWKASFKTDKFDKNGKPVYENVALSMDKFPKEYEDGKWTGHYLQQVKNPNDGEPINAQLYIRAFYTEGEAKKLMASNLVH